MRRRLWPWPRKAERKAAIRHATAQADKSRALAGQARDLAADVRRMSTENHFAEVITAAITGRAGNEDHQ